LTDDSFIRLFGNNTQVARAFANFLALANTAETHNKARHGLILSRIQATNTTNSENV